MQAECLGQSGDISGEFNNFTNPDKAMFQAIQRVPCILDMVVSSNFLIIICIFSQTQVPYQTAQTLARKSYKFGNKQTKSVAALKAKLI